jgi:hypothetical protein
MITTWFFSTRHLSLGGLFRAAVRGFFYAALLFPLMHWLVLLAGWGEELDLLKAMLLAGGFAALISQAEIFFGRRIGLASGALIRRFDGLVCALLTLVFIVYLMFLYGLGGPFPGHDSLLVPVLSKLLDQHGLLVTHLSPDEPGKFYPPGTASALSLLTISAEPVTRLMAWKALSLDSLAIAPLLWALAMRAWFGLRRPLWHVTLANMVALVMVVRDPVLGAWLKNAQFITFCTMMPTALWLFAPYRRWLRGALLAVPLWAGLGLYYFTAVHFLAAWIGGNWLMRVALKPACWRRSIFGLIGQFLGWAAMVAVIWLYLGQIPDDPRTAPSWAVLPWLARWPQAWDLLTGNAEKFWFILPEVKWDILAVGWRKAMLLGCVLITISMMFRLSQQSLLYQARAYGRMMGASLIGIGFLWLVASGLLPAGINTDYARWLVWPFQMILVSGCLLAVTTPCRLRRPWRLMLAAGFVACLVGGGVIAERDARAIMAFRRAESVNASSLRSLQSILSFQKCIVITQSQSVLGGLHHPAIERLADFIDVVTPCRMAGGSFSRAPMIEGNVQKGLPSRAIMEQWQQQNIPVFGIGGIDLLQKMVAADLNGGITPLMDMSDQSMLFRYDLITR